MSTFRPRNWYDADVSSELRVIRQQSLDDPYSLSRWRHARVAPRLAECLVYPLIDGPGLGLFVLFPPMLWILSLPIFDLISLIDPLNRKNWALGLFVAPVLIPMFFSFAMTFGYILLFLGRVLIASAMGENDHPHWPDWSPADISEGLGRWLWAAIAGLAVGGLPAAAFWKYYGAPDQRTSVVLSILVCLGVAIAQMVLAAALMHDTILAANPVTALTAIGRIGRAYLLPAVTGGVMTLALAGAMYSLIYRMSQMWTEGVALWGFWVFALYAGMVVMRMLGLTYHAFAMDLYWFRRRPRWSVGNRTGRIYANS